jgi:hypothetical protein
MEHRWNRGVQPTCTGLKSGEKATNISLLQIDLDPAETAVVQVVVREQDNAKLSAIEEAVEGYGERSRFSHSNIGLTLRSSRPLSAALQASAELYR